MVGGAVGEGDHDLAAAVSRGFEGLKQRRVFAHRALEVQAGEHRRTVEGNMEFTIAGRREIGLGKRQQHGVDGNQSPPLLPGRLYGQR